MNERIVAAVDSRILVTGHGSNLVDGGLIGEIDSEEFGFERTNTQFAAPYESQEGPVGMTGQPNSHRGDVRVGGRYSGIEGAVGNLRLLVHIPGS